MKVKTEEEKTQETPTTPTTPSTPELTPGAVQTGDATPFAAPLMMMLMAAAMFAGVSVIRARKRK